MLVLHAKRAVLVHPKDNVATALETLEPGDTVTLTAAETQVTVKLAASIPSGHKFSLYLLKAGSPVLKYGETIGTATQDIGPGEHVHVHNVVSNRARGDLTGREQ